MTNPPVLLVDRVSKTFGGLKALNAVSLGVSHNEIVGVIGPNGAGKTALINVITGFYKCDSGSFSVSGKNMTGKSLHAIGRGGVARTFQNLRLFRRMSVLENVLAAQPAYVRAPFRSLFAFNRRQDVDAAASLLERLGLLDRADSPAGALSYGEGRRLEIARALATRPKLLLLDEPAAGMNEEETSVLSASIHDIRRDVEGILLVEHDIEFIATLANRIIALDSGEKVCEGLPSEVFSNPRVLESYLGETAEQTDVQDARS